MRRRASPVTAGLQGSIDDEDDNNNKQFPSLNEVRCAVHFSWSTVWTDPRTPESINASGRQRPEYTFVALTAADSAVFWL